MTSRLRRVAVTTLALVASAVAGPVGADTVFLSTQLRPIEEAQKVREVILKDFTGPVQFVSEDTGPFLNRVKAEAQAKKVAVSPNRCCKGIERSALNRSSEW